MNERFLKAEMIIFGDDLNSLADYLGMARQTLARKMNEASFTQEEMFKIKNRYNLSDEKFVQIFTKEYEENECDRSSEAVK